MGRIHFSRATSRRCARLCSSAAISRIAISPAATTCSSSTRRSRVNYFGTENPIGRRVGTRKDVFDWEIVGVVKDAKYTGLREEPLRMAFVPLRTGPWASSMVLHVRSAAGAAGLAASIRATVQKLDRAVPIFDVHTVRDEIDPRAAPRAPRPHGDVDLWRPRPAPRCDRPLWNGLARRRTVNTRVWHSCRH